MDWEKGYTEDYERLHEKADSSTDLKGTFMDIRINKVLFQRAVIFEIVEIDDNRRVIAMKINPDRVITSKQLDEKPDVLLVLTDTNKEKGLGMMVNLENDKIEPIGEFKRYKHHHINVENEPNIETPNYEKLPNIEKWLTEEKINKFYH